jgi:Tfp pilus assembly protein PilF
MESKAGDHKRAIPLLECALQVDPQDPITLQSLGIVYGELGDVEKARAYFEQAVALTPDAPVIWCAWGQVEMKDRHNERAQQLFERALVLDSQDALTWSLLAQVKRFTGDCEAAGHCFDEAIRLSKDPRRQVRAYLEKAKMLSRIQGREADAEYAYEAALHLDAGNAFAHSAYAAFLYWRHQYPEAEEHYKCALQLRSDDTYVMASLASMLARLEGRDEEAEAYFQQALQLAPDDARTHAFYANFLTWRQRFDEAERHFVRSLELKEDAKVRRQYEEM